MFVENGPMGGKRKSGPAKQRKTKTNDLQCKNCTLAPVLECYIKQFEALNKKKVQKITLDSLEFQPIQLN
jgi:hypothetical protein